ncbi:MAG: hypothetical protein P9X24_06400 [Candidatus Hatepunaea meridiana]|nr:hypothetical protein [Candidatus Hatepunaea meridiana]
MKSIRFTKHAIEQCVERCATETEVRIAIERGQHEQVKKGREMCRFNFNYAQS